MNRDHKEWLKAQLENRFSFSKDRLPLWLSALMSAAVSLKRIADSLEALQHREHHVDVKMPHIASLSPEVMRQIDAYARGRYPFYPFRPTEDPIGDPGISDERN